MRYLLLPTLFWACSEYDITNKEDGSSANFVTMSSNGRVQGTPREDDIGEYSARIIVSDGTDAAIQVFDLIVNE